MKAKFIAAALTALVALSISASTQAQTTLKIGYTSVDAVLGQMPEAKQIENELKTKGAQYEKMLQEKYQEYQSEVQNYQKNAQQMSDVIRIDKEKKIQALEQSIQEFQKNSQDDLQKKQNQLLQPVLTKIQTAVEAVAKENGVNYVINLDAGTSAPIFLVASPEGDITELVCKKLGVPAPKKADPAAPASTPASTPAQPKKN